MKFTAGFILTLFISAIAAQAPAIEWQKSLGGLDWDASRQVFPLADGGYLIHAFSNSFDGDVIGNHGEDIWLFKTDSIGNILWQKCLGGSGWEEPYDLHFTPDGGYIIAGESDSEDGDVTENNGERDFWLVKTDSIGNILWQQKYGGSQREIAYGVDFTPEGGYILCGKSYSDDGDVTGHHGTTDYYDVWIVKTDSLGNLLWEKSYGGSLEEYARDIFATPDGGYLVFGWAESTDGDVVGLHGHKDYWLFKIDGDGNMLWQRCFGGSDDEFGWTMGVNLSDQTIFLGGYSRSSDGDITFTHGGFSDAWVVKTDLTGNMIWQKCFGGSETEFGRFVRNTSDHGCILSSYSSSDDGDLTLHYGEDYQSDYWIVKIDSFGVIQWQTSIGGSDNDQNYGIGETLDSSYVITGWSVNDDIDLTFNHGYRDIWLVKLETPCHQNKFFIDEDADGFGNILNYTYNCDEELAGYVLNHDDCDDADPDLHPGVEDLCNSFDDDCDGLTDEDAVYTTWYADADGDAYGNELLTTSTCDGIPPPGYISTGGDCNDADENINPGITEICNQIDDNCDDTIDDGFIYSLYYFDADGDLFGDAEQDSSNCIFPEGYVIDSTDCDDNNPEIYPGAPELLNGMDDDCDGLTDEGLDVLQFQPVQILIYPNPADDLLQIELEGASGLAAEITDVLGQTLFYFTLDSRLTIIDLALYSDGIYMLKVETNSGVMSVAFVKNSALH